MQEKEQKFSPVKQRILQFAEKLGVSKREFYKMIDVSRGTLESNTGITEDIVSKFIATFPEVDVDWLMTGRGEMQRDFATMQEKEQKILDPTKKSGIPLIPIDAMAGFFQGEQTIMLSDCDYYIVPAFKNADFLITVRGDSMTPRYFSGDLIACKKLSLTDIFFQWGKVYVIDTDQGALIKKVEQGNSSETITLVSENTNYKPFEIPRSCIYNIAIVQGIIRAE